METKSWKQSHKPLCRRGDRHLSHQINSGKREESEVGMLEDMLLCKTRLTVIATL